MYKIVQVLPALGWGGAQVFCIQLCNALAKNPNYEVTLISMYSYAFGKHLPLSMLDKRVKFITLAEKKNLHLQIFSAMYQTLESIGPDVVHTHLHAGYYCLFAYNRLNYPFKKIHTIHNIATKDAPQAGRAIYKYFFKKNIINAVAISETVYESAVKTYGDCIKTLIHNGTKPVQRTIAFDETKNKINSLKKNNNTKVLLNVARISKQKNQQLLLDVMQEMAEQNIITIILGSCTDKKVYNKLLASKPANVFFGGNVSNIGDYLLCADAFVLTSKYEGLPISLLEALSAGAVPVCTPVGGIKDVINETTGFLSENISKAAFTNALQHYLHADDAVINRLKNNDKRLFLKEFSIEACALKYDTLYHS